MTLISISCKASAKPTSGHDYWFHTLQNSAFSETWGSAMLVGAAGQNAPHIRGLLHYDWKDRAVSSFWILRRVFKDAKTINLGTLTAAKPEPRIYHFYEGGFRELALASILCLLDRNALVIFNANLTDPWHVALRNSKNPFSAIGLFGARLILKLLGGRLTLLCETENLRSLFISNGFRPLATYPLFTSVQSLNQRPQTRETDIAFFPNGAVEIALCLEIYKLLKDTSSSPVRAILVPRWGYSLSADERFNCLDLGMTLIEGTLQSDQYEELYRKTKTCVFPYVADYYTVSSSGRVLDAMALGSRAYAPLKSATVETVNAHAGGSGFDPLNLNQLIVDLLRDFSQDFVPPIPPMSASQSASFLKDMVPMTKTNESWSSSRGFGIVAGLLMFCFINFGLGFRESLGRLVDSTRLGRAMSEIATGRKWSGK